MPKTRFGCKFYVFWKEFCFFNGVVVEDEGGVDAGQLLHLLGGELTYRDFRHFVKSKETGFELAMPVGFNVKIVKIDAKNAFRMQILCFLERLKIRKMFEMSKRQEFKNWTENQKWYDFEIWRRGVERLKSKMGTEMF